MKKIITILLSLTLILSVIFSLSSCLGTLGSILSPSISKDNEDGEDDKGQKEEGGEEDKDPDKGTQGADKNEDDPEDESSEENKPSATPEGGNAGGETNQGGDADEDVIPEFYPGSDQISVSGQTKAFLSVVSIVATFEASYGRTQNSVGSGVIYKLNKESGDAYVITNYHVVYNRNATTEGGISTDIGLYLYGMELSSYKIKATYVGGSLNQDLAVLKVEGSEVLKNSSARAADIGDSDKVRVLDSVLVIGNPEGYGISVTKGIVSVESESLEMVGADAMTSLDLRVIRVDAAINEGNSGGGLFDENGNLIGIVNAKRTGSDVDNIGYAIPISYARNFAESILYYCDGDEVTSPSKALMGITITAKVLGLKVDETTGTIYRVEKVVIDSFAETSLAKEQLQVGDEILSLTIDGVKKEVTRIHHIIDHMLTARLGSELTLEIIREGAPLTVTLIVTQAAFTVVK